MWIEPNTNIRLLTAVPIDNSYSNTLFFNNKNEQENYFVSKIKHVLTNQTFIRVSNGVARLALNIGECYDCNYIMFQNTSYSNKWFYAFITNIEYVNNNCVELNFELDVMQTWFYDCTLLQCVVEREHSETDEIGENLLPENINTSGEYLYNEFNRLIRNKSEWKIILATTQTNEGTPARGGVYNGIYSALAYYAYDMTEDGVGYMNDLVSTLSKREGNPIQYIFMIPKEFCDGFGVYTPNQIEITKSFERTPNLLGDYAPKNNKLFSSPYSTFNIFCSSGNIKEYKLEYFSGERIEFVLTCAVSPNASIFCYPKNYKGVAKNYEEGVALTGLPMCSWSNDAYQQYIATHNANEGMSMLSGLLGFFVASQTGGAGALLAEGLAGTNLGFTAMNIWNNRMLANKKAPSFSGNAVVDSVFGANAFSIFAGHTHLQREYLESIDDYFNKFGYTSERLKIPNISARPHWNYVKTKECCLRGGAPSSAIQAITKIFNNGVTFWKNGDEVGNYSLVNK